MTQTCIVVLDAARARLFSYQPEGGSEPGRPGLSELSELVNEGRREHGKFSDTKPGNRWQEGGRGSTDDHRDAQIADHDEKFVKRVLGEVAQQVQDQGFAEVILIAGPKLLGVVRSLGRVAPRGVAVVEIAQDLSWMTPPQLHDHLADKDLIGVRSRMPVQPTSHMR
jgi:protein required for attachment to host cells